MTTTTPIESPLVARLVRDFAAVRVDPAAPDAWCADAPHAVMLLAGDAVRFPEGQDVAVVLPELLKACEGVVGGSVRIGVVERESEDAVARRFASRRWPSLIFFRNGQYCTALAGMHDWDEFVAYFRESLVVGPSPLPTAPVPLRGLAPARAAPGEASGAKSGVM